ncbi:MAG: hypothetical protein LC667_17150 [Thioalkalivibrio sp.]|nr:hypothetical protein [Thioalkalivibrio sp.]
MSSWIRKIAAGATAGLLATGVLLAEPVIRANQTVDAASWQLHFGNEFNYCEGCCNLSFCCGIGFPCIIIID